MIISLVYIILNEKQTKGMFNITRKFITIFTNKNKINTAIVM